MSEKRKLKIEVKEAPQKVNVTYVGKAVDFIKDTAYDEIKQKLKEKGQSEEEASEGAGKILSAAKGKKKTEKKEAIDQYIKWLNEKYPNADQNWKDNLINSFKEEGWKGAIEEEKTEKKEEQKNRKLKIIQEKIQYIPASAPQRVIDALSSEERVFIKETFGINLIAGSRKQQSEKVINLKRILKNY